MNQKISVIAGVTRQQQDTRQRLGRCLLGMLVACLITGIAPELAFAGASPFASGATAGSVYWVPVAATTLGANSVFQGSVLAQSGAITMGDTATLHNGRLLSGTAVTLKNNPISIP